MSKVILIVEDYEDTRVLMKLLLESYGYDVKEAADGLEAIENFKRYLPDLILMDISLPVMDGITATRLIRQSQNNSTVPIIALTAHGSSCYESAIDAGCNEVIAKPLDFSSLQSLLNSYFSQ